MGTAEKRGGRFARARARVRGFARTRRCGVSTGGNREGGRRRRRRAHLVWREGGGREGAHAHSPHAVRAAPGVWQPLNERPARATREPHLPSFPSPAFLRGAAAARRGASEAGGASGGARAGDGGGDGRPSTGGSDGGEGRGDAGRQPAGGHGGQGDCRGGRGGGDWWDAHRGPLGARATPRAPASAAGDGRRRAAAAAARADARGSRGGGAARGQGLRP